MECIKRFRSTAHFLYIRCKSPPQGGAADRMQPCNLCSHVCMTDFSLCMASWLSPTHGSYMTHFAFFLLIAHGKAPFEHICVFLMHIMCEEGIFHMVTCFLSACCEWMDDFFQFLAHLFSGQKGPSIQCELRIFCTYGVLVWRMFISC